MTPTETPINTGRVIIVGAGLAAQYAALKLSPHPVLMISPEALGAGASSAWAQGGVAAAMAASSAAASSTSAWSSAPRCARATASAGAAAGSAARGHVERVLLLCRQLLLRRTAIFHYRLLRQLADIIHTY